jgi:hypothetical protein
MPSPRRLASLLSLALLAPLSALAAEAASTPESLYEVSTAGSSAKLRAGEQGLFVLSVHTRSGAHVSDEAPLKLVLQSTQLTPVKTRLGQQDSVAKKEPGKEYVDPRFEVPFTAKTAGKATLDAKLTFFLCMEERCERKERTVSLPVEVL